MKQLKIRMAEHGEHTQVAEWAKANPTANFDSRIMQYPTLQVLCSYNGKPVSYAPFHRVLVMESLAVSPEASFPERAQSLRDFIKAAELIASANGIKEIHFQVSDEAVKTIAENHGFETITICRMKL